MVPTTRNLTAPPTPSWISRMGGSIDKERKGCESTRYWTHYVTLNYDLDHGISRSSGEITVSKNRRADWHGTKGMWVNRSSDLICDIDLGLGFSRLNFQIAISQEWEGQLTRNDRDASPMRCWTHYATLDLWANPWATAHTKYINWSSIGLMQDCYSFQSVGPLMGCPFSDL